MSVDILPSELPRESSISFGDALEKFVKDIVTADYDVTFKLLDLPKPIKKAMVLHKGELTPGFKYIAEYL
jgi:alpha-aminoadipic semialdehyde synthase